MNILIAEDDFTSRTLLARVLKNVGHEVVETVSGADALKKMLEPDAPRLAIFDWMMPEMDGLEVICRVRQRQTDRPPYLIMLTARGEKADIIAGLEAGANDYLAKPFNAGELRARVEVGRRMIEMQDALADKVEELRDAIEQIKTLRGIVPICGHCKQIRDDEGYWHQLEVYVRDHTEAEFSHGICPKCMEKLYPEFVKTGEVKKEKEKK
ncbi:MAG: DNA-binding response regulator [Desulfobacteraceae bacterium]|jgi:DNA-binding response OmpR family regulator|nr:MAG: DNA-binding response regulator [Desulfobacteraceae bacterium]